MVGRADPHSESKGPAMSPPHPDCSSEVSPNRASPPTLDLGGTPGGLPC